ncbi:ribosome biogenesis GTPase A [Algisphaera agarilytica]|uniref:Ribosome biogenesis GTPase A n=2 Tax=Algisphaera agarilytica TaxID=1385975 RepID=A0A7X0LKX4_9BACT|nr:ribosome biogenesis GTPase A [Algisphaera agarilytica]
MNTTRNQLTELMPRTDVVIELLDARLPGSSSNPLLDELRRNVPGKGPEGRPGDVPCITLLTKDDLADPEATAKWRDEFHNRRGVQTLAVNLSDKRATKNIPKLIRRLAPQRVEKNKPVRVTIVGIPNVGKSTLVNMLRGKSVARTGDEPAVTKGPQEIKLDRDIVLTDTPGILWPKFDDEAIGLNLAVSGAIKDTATDYDLLGPHAARYLLAQYPDRLIERYKIKDPADLPDPEDENAPFAFIELIGRKRGCLIAGGEVEMSRASELLLRELRGGKLGRVSLELP